MDDVFFKATSKERVFDIFNSYLRDAMHRGSLTFEDDGYLYYIHNRSIEDYIKSPNWIIQIPDGTQYTNLCMITEIEYMLEEDNKAIQFLVKQINDFVITAEHREFYFRRFILGEKRDDIIAYFTMYKDKYYELISTLKNVVTYAWYLNHGNGEIYIEYVEKMEKTVILGQIT